MSKPKAMQDKTVGNVPPVGSKKRQEWPSHVFLLPKERKYPYKKLVNGQWKVSCARLLAAMRRAIMNGRQDIAAKARALAQRYKCKWATKE